MTDNRLDTQVLSIRINRELVAHLDAHSRELAVRENHRVTRNQMVSRFIQEGLDAAKTQQTQAN